MSGWEERQCPICQLTRKFRANTAKWFRYAPNGHPVCKKCLDMIGTGVLNAYRIDGQTVHHTAPDRWHRHGPPDVGEL